MVMIINSTRKREISAAIIIAMCSQLRWVKQHRMASG